GGGKEKTDSREPAVRKPGKHTKKRPKNDGSTTDEKKNSVRLQRLETQVLAGSAVQPRATVAHIKLRAVKFTEKARVRIERD
ncbi:hypothetical protein KUCAC02_011736, partial [Chaenocephalus aceratus]